jgi:hypothetical protein
MTGFLLDVYYEYDWHLGNVYYQYSKIRNDETRQVIDALNSYIYGRLAVLARLLHTY